MPLSLTAAGDDDGRRLDRILRKALRDVPLSAIHRLLRKGAVLVNGEPAFADYHIRSGEIITVPDTVHADTTQNSPRKENACLAPDAILFEGAGILVLNKASGLAVHGKGSLEDLVLSYLEPKLPPSLSFRPGPLHRLDKPSSGIITFSTNLEGARTFSSLMRERKIKKFYLALIEGRIENPEIWQDELVRDRQQRRTFTGLPDDNAKTALTRVRPLAGNAASTLILAEIETGRTHQIRAQAAARGHPLVGDRKYGGRPFFQDTSKKDSGGPTAQRGSFLLHAWRMEFPAGTPFPALIEAPIPNNFPPEIQTLICRSVTAPIT